MSRAFERAAIRSRGALIALSMTAYCIIGLSCTSVAQAIPFTYTYVGNTFSQVQGGTYSDADFVAGTFTVDTSTNVGLPLDDYTSLVTSFSFTDGVQTLTEASQLSSAVFQFQTDDQGDIETWLIQLIVRFGQDFPLQGIVTANLPSQNPNLSFVLDLGSLDIGDGGGVGSNPGRWAQVIAEPASILLLGLGVIAVVSSVRRSS